MALKDFLSESLEKIKDSLKEPEGVDVVLLEKASESAPEYIREIIKNREITIPHSIIEAQLKEQVKEVKSTKDGIEIVVNKNQSMMNMDVKVRVVIESINLRKTKLTFLIDKIDLETANDSNFIQKVITPILIPLIKLIIESIIKEQIKNLSNSNITIKEKAFGGNLEMVCDFSNVPHIEKIKQEIPVINKSLVDFVEISEIVHTDNGVLVKFDIIKKEEQQQN